MLAEERRQKMIEMVGESATVTVSDLAQAFDTSESTIRRDLDRLDAAGKLVKVHGGAASVESAVAPAQSPNVTNELGMDEKRSLHTAEKRLIAAHAATLIGPEDFVYVDAGTSTLALVEALSEPATQALFATNSVSNALALTSRGCRAIVIGGNLKGLTEAIVGPGALDALLRHNFTKGFWGTNGVTPERGFTTPDPSEAMVKRISMERTDEHFVLADASKLGVVTPATFCEFADATLVTTASADHRYGTYANVVEVHA